MGHRNKLEGFTKIFQVFMKICTIREWINIMNYIDHT